MTTVTLNDILSGTGFSLQSSLSTQDILICLFITFLTALFIFFIYKKTYAGVLYSREFNVTLIIVSMVVSVIMLGISRNLALSLGMIGALSIVRFRSAIKDPKDITFLFWSISIGIVNGVQFYKLSIISSIVIGILLLFLSKKLMLNQPYMLIAKSNKDMPKEEMDRILQKHCKKYKLRNRLLTLNQDEVTMELKIKKGHEEALLYDLKKITSLTTINLFSFTGELSD